MLHFCWQQQLKKFLLASLHLVPFSPSLCHPMSNAHTGLRDQPGQWTVKRNKKEGLFNQSWWTLLLVLTRGCLVFAKMVAGVWMSDGGTSTNLVCSRYRCLFNGKPFSLTRKTQWSCFIIWGCLKHVHEMGGIVSQKEVLGEMLKNLLQHHHLLKFLETRSILGSNFSPLIWNRRSQANRADVIYFWTFSFSVHGPLLPHIL